MGVAGQVVGVDDTQPLAVSLEDRDPAAFRRHIQAASVPVEGQDVGLDAHNGDPRHPPGVHVDREQGRVDVAGDEGEPG